MLHTDDLKITPLGAGNEVGRSCIHIAYKSFELLLDCGVHPAFTGIGSLPFLDLVDLSKIDAIFITHFHLDHAGALPYLTEKTDFKGLIYMTHPTKAILRWLLNDYIRIINANSDIDFYTEDDLNSCYEKIVSIDYHQAVNLNNFRITALNAGHVLGAAMFLIENDIFKLLYTGDYSTEEDRHLKGADTSWIQKYDGDPNYILDVLICESTYGVQCHLPREEREKRLTNIVTDIVTRGGRCLLPVFALGRAQELLLILEDFWEKNQRLQKIPIYYASALANRCLSVYQAYAHMMNLNIKKDAFSFKHIKNLKNIEDHLIKNSCVIMASPGMLQSGLSRELFELFCEDSRNGTIIAGYCVQGTLAKEILNEPKEIVSMTGNKLKLNMKVDYVSFSAHVDFAQNFSFIEQCRPKTVMLVHGEANEMARLKAAIEHNYHVETMKNGEMHSVQVRRESVAVGMDLKDGPFSGLVVSDASGISLLSENELKTSILQKIRLPDMLQIIEKLRTDQYNDMSANDSFTIDQKTNHINTTSQENLNKDLPHIKGISLEHNHRDMAVSHSGSHQNMVDANQIAEKASQSSNTVTQQNHKSDLQDVVNIKDASNKSSYNIINNTELTEQTYLNDEFNTERPLQAESRDISETKHFSTVKLINSTLSKQSSQEIPREKDKNVLRDQIKDVQDMEHLVKKNIDTSIDFLDTSLGSVTNTVSEHKDITDKKEHQDSTVIESDIKNETSLNMVNTNVADNPVSHDTKNSHHESKHLIKAQLVQSEVEIPDDLSYMSNKLQEQLHNNNEQKEDSEKQPIPNDEILKESIKSVPLVDNKMTYLYESKTNQNIENKTEKKDLNQIKVENTFNATPIFIKQLLLNQFPSIDIKENTLYIQEIQVIFEDDIYLVYQSGFINDMLACTIIRLIENLTTRENVQLCKISKKAAIVKILNNYYDVLETENNVEIRKNDKMVVLNEREIKGDPELLEDVKKIIKKIVNIF